MLIDIPQDIKDKFIVREDYLNWINKETVIFAYLDLTNMFYWQDTLNWKFGIKDLIKQLLSYPAIKEIKVYYGFNERDAENSEAFHKRIKTTGAILRTKPMKFIPKHFDEKSFFQRKTITLLDDGVKKKIKELVDELNKSGIVIDEPKCNFDVEIAMDMLDDAEKITAALLFSGDSDLAAPLERLKVKGKGIGIVGVRGKVAGELQHVKDIYLDFGRLYTGKRVYISENPAKSGTA